MHLANTPVVSPDNKKPRQAGFKVYQIVALHRCHRGAALPSMNRLSDFLARFQHAIFITALFAKNSLIMNLLSGYSALPEKPSP